LTEGKIKLKTVNKFLELHASELDKGRPLTVKEVSEIINCSKGHAYNYLRALRKLASSMIA
jgi:predicted transcriptional regulator